MVLDAIAGGTYVSLGSHTLHLSYALAVLALAAVTSRMKVKLPGIERQHVGESSLPAHGSGKPERGGGGRLSQVLSTLVQCWPKRDANSSRSRWCSTSA